MSLRKSMFFHSAILVASMAIGSIPHSTFAEAANPPPQTDTDGGGGGIPDGAGNGGSGDDGTNEGGKTAPPVSCDVFNSPTWFPEGPPISESIIQINSLRYMHTVRYDTGNTYQYVFMSAGPDDLAPISGTFETWAHWGPDGNPQAIASCLN